MKNKYLSVLPIPTMGQYKVHGNNENKVIVSQSLQIQSLPNTLNTVVYNL